MEKTARDLRLAIPGENSRLAATKVMQNVEFKNTLDSLLDKLSQLASLLENQAARSQGLENCWRRACDLHAVVKRWSEQIEDEGYVRWVETFSQALQLNATPLYRRNFQ